MTAGGPMRQLDALVIGGGFFGCKVALELKAAGLRHVVVAEREKQLLSRASYVNQARIHNGYHYPRSFATARRSRDNFQRFCRDYAYAVSNGWDKYYAIAAGSKVSAAQFQRFCAAIGATCQPAWNRIGKLFAPDLIEDVFKVEEFAFDAAAIRDRVQRELADAGVHVLLGTEARIVAADADTVRLALGGEPATARHVLNCTYAALDAVGCRVTSRIKRELTEMAMIRPPPELDGLGITVMDGPFFSVMPFPAGRCYSLSHVRYTPHASWHDAADAAPAPLRSNAESMLRDSARYLPGLGKAAYLRSLFEIKAVLARNEADDGRPVLVEASPTSPRILSVLGAKIDNIYDVLDIIRQTAWEA